MKNEIDIFIRESNAIESVFDDFSFLMAKQAWEYLVSQDSLTEEVVLRTHAILMTGKLRPQDTGVLRTCNVRVGGRACPPHETVRLLFADWLFNANKPDADIIECHVDFEKIHPFVDGNGRVGRLLLLWMRVKRNQPVTIIYENNKQEYYKWFK